MDEQSSVATSERPQILDCTLRDGGYYNQWDFAPELVDAYLAAMAAIPVDAIELGFRSLPDGSFCGACAYTTDDFLAGLNLPKGPLLGVMINAKDLLQGESPAAVVDTLFDSAANSPVSLARIAAHYREVGNLAPAIERFKQLGYTVGLNIMQAAERSPDELVTAAHSAREWSVDMLYFADSLGNMDEAMVHRIITLLRREFGEPIGIHTHDNMLRALPNSIAAAAAGATWLDATVAGMGRGAGNVTTEYLLLELNRLGTANYNLLPLLELIKQHFQPLQRHFGWGPNPYYYLSGLYRVHPTYVQQMLTDSRYSSEEIVTTLEFLRDRDGRSFRPQELVQAQHSAVAHAPGKWSVAGWAEGQDVLLVAAGGEARKHRGALDRFIKRLDPKVIALNLHVPVDQEDVSAWTACHPARILMDIGKYAQLDRPLIAPVSALPEEIVADLSDALLLDYGLEIRPDTFEFGKRKCTIPRPLVAAYALALATAAGARRIFLAGFDGFGGEDARQIEMSEVLRLYQETPGARPLLAVTPSTYPVAQSSVYAPIA